LIKRFRPEPVVCDRAKRLAIWPDSGREPANLPAQHPPFFSRWDELSCRFRSVSVRSRVTHMTEAARKRGSQWEMALTMGPVDRQNLGSWKVMARA